MPNRGRTEMLSTDPGSKLRGASFLKHLSCLICFKQICFPKSKLTHILGGLGANILKIIKFNQTQYF